MGGQNLRKITALVIMGLVSLSFVIGYAVEVFASVPRARNISIFSVEGHNALLTRSGRGSRETTPREGQRLSNGNILTTGYDTQVNLTLDATSIMRMDVSSRVQVSSSRRRLSLTVSLGSALVNVTDREAGLTTDIAISTTALSVRGTMFVMSKTEEGDALIVMLSGEGVVEIPGADGERIYVPLMAREVMIIYESIGLYDPVPSYDVFDMEIEYLPLFTLEEIVNNYEYLLDIGTVTEYMLVEASHLIPILREQRERDREYWDRHVEMLLRDNPPDITIFPFDEYELIVEPVHYEDDEEDLSERFDDGALLGRLGEAIDDEPDLVTITWNPNGGSVFPTTSLLPTGSMFFDLPIPSRTGFIFEGWFDTDAPTGGHNVTGGFMVPQTNTTFWARWSQDSVTITWNPNGGTVSPGSSVFVPGSYFFNLPIPTRSGYAFEGWFDTSAEAGGNLITHESIVPSSNTTFWARWVEDRVVVTISWNANGGSVMPAASHLVPGTQFMTLPVPTRSGHIFAGWYDTSAATGGTQLTHASIVPDSNAMFWARWVAEVNNVYIIWYQNYPDGRWPAPIRTSEVPGTQFSQIFNLTSHGYIFVGWFNTSAPTGGTQITHASIVPNSDTTFWARWTPDQPATVQIVWSAEGGTVWPVYSNLVPGTVFGFLPSPTRSGYDFVGWLNTVSGLPLSSSCIVPNTNAIMSARWQPNFIPVTNISGVPSTFPAGSQTFTVQIHPGNATNANAGITWSVIDCGGTGAVVFGSTFSTHSPGVMHVRATVPHGAGVGVDFTQDFWIAVE